MLANPDAIELPQEQITNGQVFVAEHGDRLVGFAAVLDRPDSDVEVDGLFVDPTCWRQGIGRALIERCVGYAQHSNSRGLRVIGNPHARGFYERVGFRAEGTYKTRFGQGIVMRSGLDHRP